MSLAMDEDFLGTSSCTAVCNTAAVEGEAFTFLG